MFPNVLAFLLAKVFSFSITQFQIPSVLVNNVIVILKLKEPCLTFPQEVESDLNSDDSFSEISLSNSWANYLNIFISCFLLDPTLMTNAFKIQT